MKKLLVVALALVVCGGFALADWQADFDAWKALPTETRFTQKTDKSNILNLIAVSALADLDQVVLNVSAVVYDDKLNPTPRGYAADCLAKCLGIQLNAAIVKNDEQQAQLVWENIGKLADVHMTPAFSSWSLSGVKWRLHFGTSMVTAGFLSQADLDKDLVGRIHTFTVPQRIGMEWLPVHLQPVLSEVIAYIKANSDQPEKLSSCLTHLSGNYVEGELSPKEYSTILKGIIVASVDRMGKMKLDSPARQPLLDTISKVKTSLKQLQEIEGIF